MKNDYIGILGFLTVLLTVQFSGATENSLTASIDGGVVCAVASRCARVKPCVLANDSSSMPNAHKAKYVIIDTWECATSSGSVVIIHNESERSYIFGSNKKICEENVSGLVAEYGSCSGN